MPGMGLDPAYQWVEKHEKRQKTKTRAAEEDMIYTITYITYHFGLIILLLS